MIQILGLRKYGDSPRAVETFFEKNWRVPDVPTLFKDCERIVESIPHEERWNLYFTVADTREEKGRKPLKQEVVPFDIDHVTPGTEEQVFKVSCEALNLDPSKCSATASGNGVQFFVLGLDVLDGNDPKAWENLRNNYKACCVKIAAYLAEHGLEGKVDASVWSPARLMRLPLTENRKPEKKKQATIIARNLEFQEWSLKTSIGLVEVNGVDQMDAHMLRKMYGSIDLKEMLDKCSFMQANRDTPEEMSEPEWYAFLGVAAFMDKEHHPKIHEWSSRHPKYSEKETALKISQVLGSQTGPRTCRSIAQVWDKCVACPLYGEITTPAQLRGPDFISTEFTGFRQVSIGKDGTQKRGPFVPNDLKKYFLRENPMTITQNGNLWSYDGKRWTPGLKRHEIYNYAQRHVDPPPMRKDCEEFLFSLSSSVEKGEDFWGDRKEELVNFANGVLDMKTMTLHQHDPKYLFKYVLDYDWNPEARSPLWDEFMHEVLSGDEEAKRFLYEYLGYSLSGCTPVYQQAVFLIGSGANGKSTFLNVIREALGGRDNCVAVGMNDLTDPNKIRLIDGKLAAISEEIDATMLRKTSSLKNAITGGTLWAKNLYADAYTITNIAKFWFAGNHKPSSADVADGLYRRLVFIPFDRYFSPAERDPTLERRLLGKEVLSYLAVKAVDSYHELKKKGRLTPPVSSNDEIEDMRRANDSCYDFIMENLHYKDGAETSCSDVYANYVSWCEVNGVKPIHSSRKFGISVRDWLRNIGKMDEAVDPIRVRKKAAKTTKYYINVSRFDEMPEEI